MSGTSCCHQVTRLFARADIRLDGDRPWDVQVRRREFYPRLLAQGSLGLGESYMDGWWECPAIDEMVHRAFRAGLADAVFPFRRAVLRLASRLTNRQKASRARQVATRHYDIGNDLYAAMLDRRMIYSCAYWRNASSLDEAQEAKLGLICRKLRLEPGMRLLDIGCGWGGLARFAAERYGVTVTGVTVSREQAAFAAARCEGLPVSILLQDYRSVSGIFDRIVSVGMFEHVGHKNYRTFMQRCRDLLVPDGLFLLHTIGGNASTCAIDPWIDRYIFPNAVLPSPGQITNASEAFFVMEDWHSFGSDYDPTLMAWHANFAAHWPRLKERYGERFRRMWRYYLLACAGSFRARENQVWQVVFSSHGVAGGYPACR
ncbi:MAG: cyclopropane fatty acyl phospholipid synthase [Thermodesulfobacteriota bacterium]